MCAGTDLQPYHGGGWIMSSYCLEYLLALNRVWIVQNSQCMRMLVMIEVRCNYTLASHCLLLNLGTCFRG